MALHSLYCADVLIHSLTCDGDDDDEMIWVHSWKVQGQAAVCPYNEDSNLHRPRHIGHQVALLTPAVLVERPCTAARRVPTLRRRRLRNQVGDIVRTRMALCMLRLWLLPPPPVCAWHSHCFCTVAL